MKIYNYQRTILILVGDLLVNKIMIRNLHLNHWLSGFKKIIVLPDASKSPDFNPIEYLRQKF